MIRTENGRKGESRGMVLLVKCAGAGAVLGGAILAGRTYGAALCRREKLLEKIGQGLRFLEGRIALSEEMLSDGMQECSEKFFPEERGRDLFGLFSARLAGGSEIGTAWRECVRAGTEGVLGEEEQACLLRLETAFSLSDVERYSEHFRIAADEIRTFREKAADRYKKEGGLAVRLCAGLAAALILLLW